MTPAERTLRDLLVLAANRISPDPGALDLIRLRIAAQDQRTQAVYRAAWQAVQPLIQAVTAALNNAAAATPYPEARELGDAAAVTDQPLAKETVIVSDPTSASPTGHRPIILHYSTSHVSVVPEPISERPTVAAHIRVPSLETVGCIAAGPLRLTFLDAETTAHWISALTELAAQQTLAEEQAAMLRAEATDDAAGDDDPHADDYAGAQAAEAPSDSADYTDQDGDDL